VAPEAASAAAGTVLAEVVVAWTVSVLGAWAVTALEALPGF